MQGSSHVVQLTPQAIVCPIVYLPAGSHAVNKVLNLVEITIQEANVGLHLSQRTTTVDCLMNAATKRLISRSVRIKSAILRRHLKMSMNFSAEIRGLSFEQSGKTMNTIRARG
jgi:hypothetical protein